MEGLKNAMTTPKPDYFMHSRFQTTSTIRKPLSIDGSLTLRASTITNDLNKISLLLLTIDNSIKRTHQNFTLKTKLQNQITQLICPILTKLEAMAFGLINMNPKKFHSRRIEFIITFLSNVKCRDDNGAGQERRA